MPKTTMDFSKMTRVVIREAMLEAQKRRHGILTVEHLLYGYTKIMRGRVLLEGCGVSVAMLREQLNGFFPRPFPKECLTKSCRQSP